ncbi:UDP-N-acetylmuramoyl-tripeptide--D-alanyl-D-alanine ligase [Shewanella avicenniae]|uniref:UDP-N-acetylmuramoyl-tripeptide--D-alanyl-D-alanine ligase n=1 Tax=Shewanella avicenniae TaxID=2814294 RepID=A0ABX7QR96_9GAMM|nr:UDP-N-acetylmuramoyl-tripeptide--D-alanyl-D-alanine ligase [Shewanella avicenniae]QSX33989.1 UDP-N-acetylmuramoyl-tripeptide--D-alanyl-D-alanine ligase [Shewanella avicenniae]
MIALTLAEIAIALGARLLPSLALNIGVNRVTTDSRNADGSLFIALKGERFDGHDYVQDAIDNGAMAVLVHQEMRVSVPQLVVADTHQALGKLGKLVRDRVAPHCVALTGSNGKTSVKEMVASILSRQFSVLYTAGNLNNDIGVPLTALRLKLSHEYAVFELGANHPGEIDYTSDIVRPQVALVNNVGSAHLAGFGSEAGVAKAKSEIFNHLSADGTAIINADDRYADLMRQASAGHRQLAFSSETDADVMATQLTHDAGGHYQFVLNYKYQQLEIKLPLAGRHQVNNALAAASICIALNVPLDLIKTGLEAMKPVKGRMVPYQFGRVLLVDDSYNANPASVTVAINWLKELSGFRALVLGDLGELGDNAALLHRELGEQAKQAGLSALYCCGDLTQNTSEGFGSEHQQDIEQLVNKLITDIKQQTGMVTVLVKGSRSSRMERVVEALIAAQGRGEFV